MVLNKKTRRKKNKKILLPGLQHILAPQNDTPKKKKNKKTGGFFFFPPWHLPKNFSPGFLKIFPKKNPWGFFSPCARLFNKKKKKNFRGGFYFLRTFWEFFQTFSLFFFPKGVTHLGGISFWGNLILPGGDF